MNSESERDLDGGEGGEEDATEKMGRKGGVSVLVLLLIMPITVVTVAMG